jgi:hypothetical protein
MDVSCDGKKCTLIQMAGNIVQSPTFPQYDKEDLPEP